MKKLASSLLLLAAALAVTGCARPGEWGWDPAYTQHERSQQIARNADYEGKQGIQDWDTFWLTRPAGRLTIWNVR